MSRRTANGRKVTHPVLPPEASVIAAWKTFQSRLRHLSSASQGRIRDAFLLGEELHRGQERQSGDPYFTHCIAIAHMLADLHADEETMIAALLHDTVEDTPMTLTEIGEKFGPTVRALIDGLTKLSSADLGERSTLDEKIETLRKMFTLMQQDVRIMVVKLVDRLHNMQTAGFLSAEKKRALAEETLDVYVKIADRLCMQDLRDELEELCIAILEPVLYGRLLGVREKNEEHGEQITKRMDERIHTMRPSFPVEVLPERKTWIKLRAQLEAGENVVTGLSAVTAVFVCEDIDVCYWMMGVLHQLWRRETLSFQDFINAPMINGYRGLHTTVILEDGTRVRCKIRTRAMQDYAHRGVASHYSRAQTLPHLPWTERIAPLAEGMTSRSEEFFASLQSDILGESIVIHGPADQMVLVPQDATALDGAFYLFGADALSLATVRLDGQEVPFQTPLHHAVSLDVSLAAQKTVHREWLHWVHTGLATTKIRADLARRKRWKKVAEGKELLQESLRQHKLGYLEEFNEEKLLPALHALGYDSFEQVYIAVAEGRVTAEEIVSSVFQRSRKQQQGVQWYVLKFRTDIHDAAILHPLIAVRDKYNLDLSRIRWWSFPGSSLRYWRVQALLTSEEQHDLFMDLHHIGSGNVHIELLRSVRMRWWGIVLLLVLWGLDPVLAKLILSSGVSPLSFTILRAWSTLAFAMVLLLCAGRSFPFLLRIPLRSTSLWAAGIAFFFLNLLTSFSLSYTSPLLYKATLRVSVLLLAIPLLLQQKSYKRILLAWLLGGAGLFILSKVPDPLMGFLFSVATVLAFSFYTALSTYFQRVAHIHSRYPQFFFVISAIAALISLVPLLFMDAPLPSAYLIVAIALFSIFFVSLPYIIFYALSQSVEHLTLSPLFQLYILVTLFGQIMFFGTENLYLLISASTLLIISTFLVSNASFRWQEIKGPHAPQPSGEHLQ